MNKTEKPPQKTPPNTHMNKSTAESLGFTQETSGGFRVSAYDASNSEAGEQAWPESSVDVPDEWGQSWSLMESVPEGLTFAVMVLLASVSLIVGSQYLRKRSKKQ